MGNLEYNLSDLVADLVAEPEVPIMDPESIKAVLDYAFRYTAKRVATDGRVEFKGFGVIDLVPRQARSGILFADQSKPWKIGPYYELEFNPDPSFLQIAADNKNPDLPDIPIRR